ncbi:4Fe-4S binding protein [Desulfitibacter alkalitolerans]|uniref:4Fe-4S binding protein n=1 Tax=Desulfitibacter alkalitolerans TaxID=264641 RepID=UPI00047FEB06|nr:4Fe-4S binding protein [Desulfitibacter alkalitolerans]
MYYAAKVAMEKCTGCKLCIFACPEPNAIKYIHKTKIVEVEPARCKGCGLCVTACKKEALEIS